MKRDPSLREAMDAVIADARALSEEHDVSRDNLHADRVWRNARIVGEYAERDENWVIDGDVLKLATYLHVVAPRAESVAEQVRASAMLAEGILRTHGLAQLVWPVGQVIMELSPALGREPSFAETKVLRDADRLDSLGAIGIARCFATGTLLGATAFYDRDDPLAVNRELDDSTYILDHFRTNLLHISQNMFTRYARAEGQRRTRVVRAYYDALLKEAGFMLGSENE